MKKTAIGIITIVAIGYSCTKDEPIVEPTLEITQVLNESVNVYDTLEIAYKVQGIDTWEEIEVFIDEVKCAVIENTGSSIKAIVSYGIDEATVPLILKHTKASSPGFLVTIGIVPHVTGFYPAEGVGGDTLVVKGWGFDHLIPEKVLRINSLPATMVSSSDTMLVAIVPGGCGSGKVRLQQYYPGGTHDGEPVYLLDEEWICGAFTYQFSPWSGNVYPVAYVEQWEGGENVVFERENGILQKEVYSTTKYSLYRYKDSQIDSILNYDNDELVSYETFLVHEGGDEVVHNFFNSEGHMTAYYTYKLSAGKVAEWDFYEYSEDLSDFYLSGKNLFAQQADRYTLDRTVYHSDGSVSYHPVYEGFIDIDNQALDFNIPGYPLAEETIWIYNGENTYHNYYNDYGLLVKRVLCPLRISEEQGSVREYLYE